MKRITNILSYLCLLLLLLVVACSDLEEITIAMQGEEEVELTIQTNIPSLGGSTRTAPTENITSITALAFDSDYELVKVVKATLNRDETNGENNSTTGTMTIKVPVRTRRIHFIAQNDDEFSRITDADYGRTDIDLLKTLASDELHYWQVANFTNKTNLQSFNNGAELKLIRNKARVYLTLPQDASMTGHIVGFLNYNTTGTIAASKNEAFGYVATGDNHEMPSTFFVTSDSDPNANLGYEHYLFEEKNTKGADGFGEAADLVYVVCWIKKGDEAGKYYKIAFKSGESYYHIIRNLEYEIKISKDLDTTRGYANFADAVAKAPINDAGAKVQIHMDFNPDPLSLLLGGDPGTTTITGFEGIQTLQIGYPKAYFDRWGVAITGMTPTDTTTVTAEGGNKIWVDTYSIADQTSLELTATLLSSIKDAHKDIQIQFLGEGSEVFVDDILHANALQRGDLTITTSATKIPNVEGSQFTASVPVQSYAQDVGEYRLFIGGANEAFTITLPDGVRTLADGSYEVTNLAGSQAVFKFTLKDDGEAGYEHEISFDLYTDFHHFIGTTTVTLVEEEIVREIVATPSANSLNYAGSSVEDLWVKVTIPKEVNKLTFASSHFKIMATGGGLTATDGGYTVAHEEGATETTTSVRIRLNDDVSGMAQFTFGGVSDKSNVTVQEDTESINLNNNGDANVRWQGNVPLNENNYDAIVPLKYEWFESIATGSKLNLEFNVTGGDTSWLEVFEIQGENENDWTNHKFEELKKDDYRYVATGNGNYTLSLTITDEILEIIKDNFRSDFLGETKIAMAIRGVGITLTKVSVVPDEPEELQTVAITATPQTSLQTTSLGYSANSVSDLIVNVTIPAGVTTLEFSSEYFDVGVVNDEHLTDNGDGRTYTRKDNNQVSTYIRLRLKNKIATENAGFTFSGAGNNLYVIPAEVNNITLQESVDENVRWQGDVLLNWNANGPAPQIPLPYSWFEGLSPGSKLRVEYEVTDADKSDNDRDAVIQFTEVRSDSWTDYSYFFEELRAGDNNDMGLNLSKQSATNIYSGTSVELALTQTILTQMNENKVSFQGLDNIAMAIQGGNARLKKISVIPAGEGGGSDNNNQLDMSLAFITSNGVALDNMIFGISALNLNVTIPAEDAQTFNGQTMSLPVTLNGNGAEQAVNWRQSCINGTMTYNDNGYLSGLQFSIQQGVTSYSFKWIFIRTDDGLRGDVTIPIAVSDSQSKVLANVSVTIKNSSMIQGTLEDNSDDNIWDAMIFNESFPIGTTIAFTLSENSTIKLCDNSNNALWVPSVMDSSDNKGDTSNPWVSISAGTLSITLNSDITLYEKGNSSNSKALLGNLNGFRIESGNTLPQTITVTAPASALNQQN